MVFVTAKSPEDGLTAVNYNNNDQSNAEEFREEKGTFHSSLSEKLILSLTSGWTDMSYRLKTSATRQLDSHDQAVVHNLQTKPHQREGAAPHRLPNSCPGEGEIWNLKKSECTSGNTPQPMPQCHPSTEVGQALGPPHSGGLSYTIVFILWTPTHCQDLRIIL